MADKGVSDPPDEGGNGSTTNKTNTAQQLFGHKGGAKPWDQPGAGDDFPIEPPEKSAAVSAPYPKDAQYTPRNSESDGALSEEAESDELTKLHPNYKLLMRLIALIAGLVIAIASIIAETALSEKFDIPSFIIIGPALLLALIIVIRVPLARYNARGYQMSADRLRVVRGVLWRSDTIVPFGRVQHIDVDQGPVERALGISTLTLHTAGNHNASVRLPGLGHELAVEMREDIRAHIKRESL